MTEANTAPQDAAPDEDSTRPSRGFWREPFWQTVIVAVLLVGITAAILPRRFSGNRLWREQIEATQISWKHKFDAVVLGDSRASQGISPDTLERMLPGTRVGNLAMPGVNFAGQYIRTAERALDPASERRFVVLSLSPFVLNLRHPSKGRFNNLLKLKNGELIERRYLRPAAWRFSPVALQDLTRWRRQLKRGENPFAKQAVYAIKEEHGFVGRMDPYRRVNEKRMIDLYLSKMRPAVDPARLEGLVRWIAQWRQKGIRVFLVRSPTSPAMREAEDEIGGVGDALQEVARRATAEGAVWLVPPEKDWVSYDGSHLQRDSAYAYSEWLGQAIAWHYGAGAPANPQPETDKKAAPGTTLGEI